MSFSAKLSDFGNAIKHQARRANVPLSAAADASTWIDEGEREELARSAE